MSSSYLGVTAHYFTQHDHMRRRGNYLAVRQINHPHTAETVQEVIDEVLTEWKIPISKVRAIVTDNGSNMIKAFREQLQDIESEESETDDGDLDEESDEPDFADKELDHEITFKFYIKRISCFTHTLQLVVQKFSEAKSFSETLKRMRTLVKKVNKSSRATEMLLSQAHKLVGYGTPYPPKLSTCDQRSNGSNFCSNGSNFCSNGSNFCSNGSNSCSNGSISCSFTEILNMLLNQWKEYEVEGYQISNAVNIQ